MLDAQRDPKSGTLAQPDREGPVLDAASLDQLRALDPQGGTFLQRVLQTYQYSLATQEDAIARAAAAADWMALSHAAHALKSASASVGALALSRLCAQIEQDVRDSRLDALAALVDQFRREAVRVHAAVAELMGGGGVP